jgi:predicted HNH restriction endonuclease
MIFERRTEIIARELIADSDNLKIFLENSPWHLKHQHYLTTLLEELKKRSENEARFSRKSSLLTHEINMRLASNNDQQIRLIGEFYQNMWRQALNSPIRKI